MNSLNNERSHAVAKWAWFAFCAIACLILVVLHMPELLESDLSTELALSKELVDKGEFIFSSNWYYQAEIRAIHNQLIYSLLFLFTDNWHLVRILSDVIIIGILEASVLFACLQLGLRRWFPIIGGLVLLPISFCYAFFVLGGMYYIPNCCLFLITLGFIVMSTKKAQSVSLIPVILAIATAILSGLSGFRSIFCYFLPLVIGSTLIAWSDIRLKVATIGSKRIEEKRTAGYQTRMRRAAISWIVTFGSLLGLLINKLVLARLFSFLGFEDLRWTTFSLDRFIAEINGILECLGVYSHGSVFGSASLVNLTGLVFAFLSIYCAIRLIRDKSSTSQLKLVGLLYLLGLGALLFCFSFTDMVYAQRYNIPVTMLAPLVIGARLSQLKPADGFITTIATCTLCLVMAFGFAYTQPGDNRNLEEKTEIADFLVENGYTQGYATYWNGNVLTEISNGQIEAWVIQGGSDSLDNLFLWGQKKDHLDNAPTERTFILVEKAELEKTPVFKEIADNQSAVFETEHYYVFEKTQDDQSDGNIDRTPS